MRQIKFRAWDQKDKRLIQKFLPDWGTIDQERYLLLQFTGLKDKNGKEIYEGDIIKCGDWVEDAHTYNSWLREVRWDLENGMWLGVEGEVNEIIGNIYESPHLLNNEQNPEVSDTTDDDSSTGAGKTNV